MSKAYGYAAYGGPDAETWMDRTVPTPGPSELLIAVKAAGVNAVDPKIRSGAMANPDATPAFPLVLGVEAAGVVLEVGSDVAGFSKNDPVMGRTAPGHGAFGEHAVLVADGAAHKPPQLSFVQAAALPVAAATAWDALDRLHLTEGETLLVTGIGGGVGVVAAQLARDRGVAVFGVASSGKRALAESLGATLLAYDEGDVAEQLQAILPDGVDAVLDAVGGQSLQQVAPLAGKPSRVVSIVDPGVAEIGGEFVVSSPSSVPQLAELVAEGKLDPKVMQTYPLDEAPEALRAVESGHVLGKIVIDVEQQTHS